MPAVPRKTGIWQRLKQAVTGAPSPSETACNAKITAAFRDLKALLEAGKISQEELDRELAKLRNGSMPSDAD